MRVHPDALLEGAVDDLAQRRVRVRREGEVSHSGTGCFGVRALLDEVRGVEAHDVHPDDFVPAAGGDPCSTAHRSIDVRQCSRVSTRIVQNV